MRVAIIHNTYRNAGGEDLVAREEARLLLDKGNEIREYWRSNNEIESNVENLKLPFQVVWAKNAIRDIDCLIQDFKPDVLHFHNTWLMISPGAYWISKRHGIPVVQTLHNYRIICPNAKLVRNGKPCELCIGKTLPFPGILFGCYRTSILQSLLVGGMITFHHSLKTWKKKVDVYIALTEFAKRKFIEAKIPEGKIVVKPNFVHPDPGLKDNNGSYALFIGRLSSEKGLQTLVNAWRKLHNIPLKVIGDGPLMGEIRSLVEKENLKWVEITGQLPQERIFSFIKKARFLVFPSLWYETFGRVVTEAFACGTPVISSNLGAMTNIVEDRKTGLHFEAGNPEDLAAKVEWAWSHSERMQEMGREARSEYEVKYTAELNYKMLMDIYQTAIERSRKNPAIQI